MDLEGIIPTISVAQIGARRHYIIPRIIHQAGLLERLYTDTCAVKGWPQLLNIIPRSLRSPALKRLLDRVPKGIPPEKITAFNEFGFEYVHRLKSAKHTAEVPAVHLWAEDRFSKLIIQNGLSSANIIYGLNVGCVDLYRSAKHCGLKVIVEQFIAPRRIEHELLVEEYKADNVWERFEQDELIDEICRREHESWSLADLILCGSEFVRQGVIAQAGPAEKCLVVPYGVQVTDYANNINLTHEKNKLLNVLFVGAVGPRKGVRYLFDAMKRLIGQPVKCRIIGNIQISQDILQKYIPPNVELIGPFPRSEVHREYARADVFCLPSLCEGSATVIYEALGAGLPVITTENSGSIVRHGIEGFIVPIRDSGAIADYLERFIKDPEHLRSMSLAAHKRSQLGSFEAYSSRLLEAINSITDRKL
jgi:glycosyltransferase involved in cell wall biosynthesis